MSACMLFKDVGPTPRGAGGQDGSAQHLRARAPIFLPTWNFAQVPRPSDHGTYTHEADAAVKGGKYMVQTVELSDEVSNSKADSDMP